MTPGGTESSTQDIARKTGRNQVVMIGASGAFLAVTAR